MRTQSRRVVPENLRTVISSTKHWRSLLAAAEETGLFMEGYSWLKGTIMFKTVRQLKGDLHACASAGSGRPDWTCPGFVER